MAVQAARLSGREAGGGGSMSVRGVRDSPSWSGWEPAPRASLLAVKEGRLAGAVVSVGGGGVEVVPAGGLVQAGLVQARARASRRPGPRRPAWGASQAARIGVTIAHTAVREVG